MPQKPCNPPQAGRGARHHKHRRVSAPVPWHSCLQRHDAQAEATVPVFQRHGLQRIEYVWWTSISRSPQDPRHSSTVTDVQRGTANTVVSVLLQCGILARADLSPGFRAQSANRYTTGPNATWRNSGPLLQIRAGALRLIRRNAKSFRRLQNPAARN